MPQALVTGATSGIGRALALALRDAGHEVVACQHGGLLRHRARVLDFAPAAPQDAGNAGGPNDR